MRLLPTRADYADARPLRDLNAGLVVAMVALPLALGFGVSSGVSAEAGLVTAVVAGILAAIFGGSRLQVSGPTGAMTVVLIPIVAAHGTGGVLVVGILAGAILVGLAFLKAGRLVSYVPVSVVEGFTVGIAAVIALQQVPQALGTEAEGTQVVAIAVDSVRQWLVDPDWLVLGITAFVVAVLVTGARLWPGIPAALGLVALVTLANHGFGWDVATIGELPSGLPVPALPTVPLGDLPSLLLPAIAVAALGALESLLSATVADAMSVRRHLDPDRELFGQGIANLVAPLFGESRPQVRSHAPPSMPEPAPPRDWPRSYTPC